MPRPGQPYRPEDPYDEHSRIGRIPAGQLRPLVNLSGGVQLADRQGVFAQSRSRPAKRRTVSYPRPMGNNPYKRMAEKFGAHYDPGITKLRVLTRDKWTCRMEVCLYENRSIDPNVQRVDNGVIPDEGGTVDHITPLSVPGTPGHMDSNVRAAHRLCNRVDFARVAGFWATGDAALLAGPVADSLVEELRSMRKSIRSAPSRGDSPYTTPAGRGVSPLV